MARVPVVAAGGIVLRRDKTPLIAVVRVRKRNEWVLPKGKLDDGETPRDAAEREVREETGHDPSVHEFLGTLVYESGGRSKVVHYWRMETSGEPSHELMDDVRAVDWLPLEAAVERLSRFYEQTFLAHVGPLALELARRPRAKQTAPAKRRSRRVVVPEPVRPIPVSDSPVPTEVPAPALPPPELIGPEIPQDEPVLQEGELEAADASIAPMEFEAVTEFAEEAFEAPAAEARCEDAAARTAKSERVNLVQKVRDWLRRAA
jgi:8-oxo-dGTP diphosphatase